jgi:hypothetical protein
MSINTASLGIMSSDAFKNRTKASTNVCGFSSHFKSRGSSMSGIDSALETWDSLLNKDKSVDGQRLFTLNLIVLTCDAYLQDRSNKDSTLAASRKSVVQELRNSVDAAQAYVKKRSSGGAQPGTKSLAGAYANERTQYVDSGKQANPYSASALHGKGAHDTYADFIQLGAASGGQQVEFMNRTDRLKYLVVIKNGLFYQGGMPYSCNTKAQGRKDKATQKVIAATVQYSIDAVTFAMDKYGNIFSKKGGETVQEGGLRFNHSTYCAGKEVVCAGTFVCLNGQLLCITNSSGHYKPTGSNVRAALIMLAAEGVDLTTVAVIGQGLVAGDGACKASTLVAQNAPAAADWPNPFVFKEGTVSPHLEVDHKGMRFSVWEPG